jgi:hypothetical protein
MTREAVKIPKKTRKMVLFQLSMNVPKKYITEATGMSFYLIQRIIAEEKAAKQLRKEKRLEQERAIKKQRKAPKQKKEVDSDDE